jgi:formyl-CoA transferase
VGNDRQWKAMVSQEIFQSLDKPEYETNAGRIGNVPKMNSAINAITKNHSSAELIELFNAITVPVSKINSIPEVLADPLVQQRLLSAEDPVTGTKITMPPTPNLTPYLEGLNRQLSFPPRFGEHNKEIIGGILGYSDEELKQFKERKII